MAKPIISAEQARAMLSYDPFTGVFTRRLNRSHNAKAGDVAGYQRQDGYWVIGVNGYQYRAHRLAWLITQGAWPDVDIDHIDGNPSNNRIANLRQATRSENLQNQNKAHSGSTSGILGVHWSNQRKKWVAAITVNGKVRSLGRWESKDLAHQAYLRAKAALHPFSPTDNPGGKVYEPIPSRAYTSEFRGIGWDNQRGKWRVQITKAGRNAFIGRYTTEEAAHSAYLDAIAVMTP